MYLLSDLKVQYFCVQCVIKIVDPIAFLIPELQPVLYENKPGALGLLLVLVAVNACSRQAEW